MIQIANVSQFLYLDGKWVRGVNPLRAEALYLNHSLNLQTGHQTTTQVSTFLDEWLGESFQKKRERPLVTHLFYELGVLLQGGSVDESTLLGIFIEFESLEEYQPQKGEIYLRELQSPSFTTYESAFARGHEHLLRGDCYQFNLTYPFVYNCSEELSAKSFIGALKKPGAFAHACDLELLGMSLISNSPESLFEREGTDTIVTRPIKGTLRSSPGARERLLESKKDCAELDMITDLLRNDLNRIERPTAKVRARSKVLEVTHLLHLYSEIAITLSPAVSLREIMLSLFPSGSVTGAPKKRVMEILCGLEEGSRGLYCGSTLFSHGDNLQANVNIRSGIVERDKEIFTYHAGGGCTLLSSPKGEYREMLDKVESFLGSVLNTNVRKSS